MKIQILLIALYIRFQNTGAIIGGKNSTIEEVPWLVLLRDAKVTFSGVLISDRYILSLATYCKRSVGWMEGIEEFHNYCYQSEL